MAAARLNIDPMPINQEQIARSGCGSFWRSILQALRWVGDGASELCSPFGTLIAQMCCIIFCCTPRAELSTGNHGVVGTAVPAHATLDSCCGEMEFVDVTIPQNSTLFEAKEAFLRKLFGSTTAVTETRLFCSKDDPRKSCLPCKFPYRVYDTTVSRLPGTYVLVSVIGREVSYL